jgi:hypothetical protein
MGDKADGTMGPRFRDLPFPLVVVPLLGHSMALSGLDFMILL